MNEEKKEISFFTVSGLPDNEIEDAKEYCKSSMPEILGLEPDSADGFICPLCGSGSGPHGTGMTTRDGTHYRCWVCSETFDVFDLAERMEDEGVAHFKGENIFEKVYREAGLLDMTPEERQKLYDSFEPPPRMVANKTLHPRNQRKVNAVTEPPEVPDYTDLYPLAERNFWSDKGIHAREYMYSRGFTADTLHRFHIGYREAKYCGKLRIPSSQADQVTSSYPVDDGWIDTTNGLGAILLPISNDCYILRNLNKESNRRYAKVTGKNNPFKILNAPKLLKELPAIFIVEGYFDALSIVQAGYPAIPIGTAGAPTDLQNTIAYAYDQGKLKNTTLVICEDNDAPGAKGLKKIVAFLHTLQGIKYCLCDPCKGITDSNGNGLKDANDALVNNPERFKMNLDNAVKGPVITVMENQEQIYIAAAETDAITTTVEDAYCFENNDLPSNENIDCSTEHLELTSDLCLNSETPSISATNSDARRLCVIPASERLDQLVADDGSRYRAISTCIPSVDELLMGGLRTGLYGLQGLSGQGKSTLAIQIADNIASQGRPVLIVSLEMAAVDIIAKSLARYMFLEIYKNHQCESNVCTKSSTDILTKKLHSNRWNTRECMVFDEVVEQYRGISNNIFIVEGGMVSSPEAVHTVDKIENCVVDINTLTGSYPVVIVDYIQKLKGPTTGYITKNTTEKQIIDDSVYNLRQIATKYGIPVIGILSMNRQSYRDGVSLSSSKGSGDIEYSCDVLLGLEKPNSAICSNATRALCIPTNQPKQLLLKVNKNRYGIPDISTTLEFHGKECCFIDPNSLYDESSYYDTSIYDGEDIILPH